MLCFSLAALLLGASISAAPTNDSQACAPSHIEWTDCATANETPGLQCANFTVPVDWSQPCNGAKTYRLALARLKARDEGQRIGPLFFNTGGPGGQAIPELVGNGSGIIPFSKEVRDKFDLVAIDPRGIGQSEPIYCNHTLFNEMASLNQFPRTEQEFDALYAASQRFGQSCEDMTGDLVHHIDSRTVTQDFEAVRLALGAEKMYYLGLSYGTLIGQAYIELFPDNIGAMVLDSVVDHTQRQTYTVLTEARTYESVLDKFFEWCDGDLKCAVHNDTFKTADLWDQLITEAEAEPIPAPECSDHSLYCAPSVSASDILYAAQERLLIEKPIPSAPDLDAITWPALAEGLHEAFYNRNATTFSRTIYPVDYLFGATAVARFDWNISITSFAALQNEMLMLNTTAPHTHGICEFYKVMIQSIGWSAQSPPSFPQQVPQIRELSAKVLMINAFFDPETSYEWAVALQNEVLGSVLVGRDGVGHTSYALKGEAYELANRYLLTLEMPEAGTIVYS